MLLFCIANGNLEPPILVPDFSRSIFVDRDEPQDTVTCMPGPIAASVSNPACLSPPVICESEGETYVDWYLLRFGVMNSAPIFVSAGG